METLDQNENSNSRISERSIRYLSSSATWIIISSACGIVTGLYFLYIALAMMSISRYGYGGGGASIVGGFLLIFALIATSLHIVGLTYGLGLSKIKVYSAEEMEKASAKQNAYWIFAGIAYIVWTLLMLLSLANGGGMGRF